MAIPIRRRYPFRDRDITARWTAKLGTETARVFYVLCEPGGDAIDYMSQLVMLAVAHHIDLMSLAEVEGRSKVAYPEDVADLVGITSKRAGVIMNEIKRKGFLEGTAAAGYTLPSPSAR